jgi:cellulose synthase/poly-beta-1,6-N-acetylglucosamine synthase-like glycosyltransferase
MIAAIVMAIITASYLILGRIGMNRLDKQRRSLELPRRLPLVSIIIPAYKSQATINKTLESARGLDYPRKEIMVVNDSQDSTPSIARSFGARAIQNKKRIGKPAALNKAIKEARGDLIFVLDADTTVARGCLKRIVPWFTREDVSVVMPRYLLKDTGPISKLASLENLFTFALLRIHMFFGSMVGFRGCSVVIRKKVLEKHPWPNTLLEDNHLSATLASKGHRIIWEPLAVAWTEEPGTISELKKQKRRWGEGAYMAFRFHWRFYLRSPQFITFLYPYFAIGITSGLLIISLLLSPMLFPWMIGPIVSELILLFIAMYLHTLIFLYLGGGGFAPLKTLGFMAIYFPIMSYSYFRGVLSGIMRKKKGRSELHFRHW